MHFDEVQSLAKRDENGNLVGLWGAMSDMSLSFLPWEQNFCIGRYLAGVECEEDVQAPEGWTRWLIPGYSYLVVEYENENTFSEMIRYLSENRIDLVGAVHDFTCPTTGKNYMFFPVKKI